ncbi:MAG: phage terminase large subunit [Christensenellales bacterium]|jgi:phage terminase large subunit
MISVEEKVLWKAFGRPTVKQAAFLKADTRYVGYGGAKGGGKSHAVRAKATYLAFAHPGIQMLIVRRTLPELRENHTNRLLKEYHAFPEYLRPKYNGDEKAFIFPWGSRIKLGYCDSENDVLQYQGQEYDVLFLDEATQLSENQFGWLNACVRGVGAYPKRTYVTCNPGGTGHGWVKRLFIDKDYRRSESARDYTFIQALVWDNTPLFNGDAGYIRALKRLKKQYGNEKPLSELKKMAAHEADYVRQLESLPSALRRAWLDGDWNVFAGQFFGEFREETHVCAPFLIPDGWRRSAAIDYGLDMLAVLWFAVNPAGRVFCYRNIERPNLTISKAAKEILNAGSESVAEYIAPPDLWSRRQDSGRSAADIFAENGVPLIRAGNSRIDGWLCVKEYLNDSGGIPKMKFFSVCTPVLRALPLLQHDGYNVNDVATEPHDITHSPDALRYWCSLRQLCPEANRPAEANPFAQFKKNGSGEVGEAFLLGGYGR